MPDSKIYYSPKTKNFARELRKNPTKEENKLWYEMLRTYKPQFRRQKQIGAYIVDFYCSAAKLIVELDGGQHYEPEKIEYDNIRTTYLTSLGLTVMRFTNIEVNTNFFGVCTTIDNYIKSNGSHPST